MKKQFVKHKLSRKYPIFAIKIFRGHSGTLTDDCSVQELDSILSMGLQFKNHQIYIEFSEYNHQIQYKFGDYVKMISYLCGTKTIGYDTKNRITTY